jgi:hypothetical protein
MPRLRYIEENEKTPYTRELIESAKRTGAPDPRVVSLMTRSKLGIAWVEYWNKLLYQSCFAPYADANPAKLAKASEGWWGWEDSNLQPNDYQLLACEVPEVSRFATGALSPD